MTFQYFLLNFTTERDGYYVKAKVIYRPVHNGAGRREVREPPGDRESRAQPKRCQQAELDQRFISWKGDFPQVDDVCVLGFKLG